jgi:PAS domain S-box-containing protein
VKLVGFLLQCLNLVLHCGVLGIIARQLRSPYRFTDWTVAWGCLALGMLVLLVFRVNDFYQPYDYWRMFVAVPMMVFLFIGFYALSLVFSIQLHVDLEIPTAIIVVNPSSVIHDWNYGAELLFGWAAAEVIGQTLMQTIIPERAWMAHTHAVAVLLQTDQPGRMLGRTVAVTARHKDGHEFPVQIILTRIPATGTVTHFHATIQRLLVP